MFSLALRFLSLISNSSLLCKISFNILTIFFSSSRDIDKVHDLMDDVAEQQEIANEISEAISNPVGFGQDVDEVINMMFTGITVLIAL